MDWAKLINYLKYDIWRLRLEDLPPKKSLIINNLRVIYLTVRGFLEDQCSLRASALTFYSILSIVPAAAMAFGVAKGFGFEQRLQSLLLEKFPEHQEVVVRIIEFAHSLLERTKGGVVAGVGLLILFWTILEVLSNIEKALNSIWGIKKPRPFGRKFADYLSIVFICPILLILSSSITVFIASQFSSIGSSIQLTGVFQYFSFLFFKMSPYAITAILFSFIYIFMPNTKVKLKSGILAGILAGVLYQLVQTFYVFSQVTMSKYNAIYGSFAALPMFLVWLQVSWLIVLLGAELSFVIQNVSTYEFEYETDHVSHSFKKLLCLNVTQLAIHRFQEGGVAISSDELSKSLKIPSRLLRSILFELTEAGLLAEVKGKDDRVRGYHPAMPIDQLTINEVLTTLDHQGIGDIPVLENSVMKEIRSAITEMESKLADLPENLLLKNLRITVENQEAST